MAAFSLRLNLAAEPRHGGLSMQNEAISLAAICSKELRLVEENCATVNLDMS